MKVWVANPTSGLSRRLGHDVVLAVARAPLVAVASLSSVLSTRFARWLTVLWVDLQR